jgi:hypothetical protein
MSSAAAMAGWLAGWLSRPIASHSAHEPCAALRVQEEQPGLSTASAASLQLSGKHDPRAQLEGTGEVRYRTFTSVSEHCRVLADDDAMETVQLWRNKVAPVRGTKHDIKAQRNSTVVVGTPAGTGTGTGNGAGA